MNQMIKLKLVPTGNECSEHENAEPVNGHGCEDPFIAKLVWCVRLFHAFRHCLVFTGYQGLVYTLQYPT